jgi:hypothetical protein
MWALENLTPYAAERSWVQDKNGVQHWIVVVKATYEILPDASVRLANEQVPIFRLALHRGDPAKSSLIYDADIIGRKVTTDIVVNGNAHAPNGRRVDTLEVRVTVGSVDKTLTVTGNRNWHAGVSGIAMTSPEPFETMPIAYERAFGGFDQTGRDPTQHRMFDANPVGVGFATHPKHLHNSAVPNIEYPSERLRDWTQRPAPAGLGPIPRWWTPRREYAGTYDQRWIEQRAPLWAVDFDERYHQSAPPDQQTAGFLRGGEVVELTNLTPSGRLRFAIPKVHLGFTSFFGREQQHHGGHLDAVIIEPDQNRVMLVWQSLLNCHHKVDYLDRTRILQKSNFAPSPAGASAFAGTRGA